MVTDFGHFYFIFTPQSPASFAYYLFSTKFSNRFWSQILVIFYFQLNFLTDFGHRFWSFLFHFHPALTLFYAHYLFSTKFSHGFWSRILVSFISFSSRTHPHLLHIIYFQLNFLTDFGHSFWSFLFHFHPALTRIFCALFFFN